MGVAKKRKRKLAVDGRKFLWYVKENEDGHGLVLHVLSEDKAFLVMYQVGQPPGDEYIVVLGPEFVGADTGGCWRRFRCPRFDPDAVVTTGIVREVILWALDPQKDLEEITWKECPLRL